MFAECPVSELSKRNAQGHVNKMCPDHSTWGGGGGREAEQFSLASQFRGVSPVESCSRASSGP